MIEKKEKNMEDRIREIVSPSKKSKNIENKLRELKKEESIIGKEEFEAYLSKNILKSDKPILKEGRAITSWHFKRKSCLEIIELQVKNGFSEYAVNVAERANLKFSKLDMYSKIASIYAQEGMIKDAKKIAKKIKQSEDSKYYRLALSEIALAEEKAGRREEAKITFDAALKDLSGFMFAEEIYIPIALAQAKAGMIEESKATFKVATEAMDFSSGNESVGYSELAEAQAKAGFFEDALESAGKAYTRWKIVPGYCSVALEMAKVNKIEEAKEIFRKAPGSIDFEAEEQEENYCNMASFQAKAGFFEDSLESAIKAGSDKYKAYYYIISAQTEKGLIDEALETVSKIKDYYYRFFSYIDIASAQIKLGFTEKARDTLKKALKAAKRCGEDFNPNINTTIALSYTKEGLFDKAKEHLELAKKEQNEDYADLPIAKAYLEAYNQLKVA